MQFVFPYRNKIYTDDDKLKVFNNLKNYKLTQREIYLPVKHIQRFITIAPQFYSKSNRYKYILYNDADYFTVMILSDFFMDQCRSKCTFNNNPSPYEWFMENRKEIKTKYPEITPVQLRDYIYKHTKECSIHHPAIIQHYIKTYNAKKVLDPCGGWGDRLLGALAANVDIYMSSDPNACLHPKYKAMAKMFKQTKTSKFIFNKCKFQDLDLTKYDDYFDLIYTSPPYFDYEIYEHMNKTELTSVDIWFNEFLVVMLEKCIKALRKGGHMVLYFSEKSGTGYINRMLFHIRNKYPTMMYEGIEIYASIKLKGSHPIFIWRKL